MKTAVTYGIGAPCHEDWNAMLPGSNGRFCQSCQKTVVDFSRMSQGAIERYMQTATGEVCGRMTATQLAPPITMFAAESALAFSLRALVLGAALSAFTALPAYAQGQVEHVKGEMVAKPVVTQPLIADTAPTRETVFSGTVIDYLQDVFVSGVAVFLFDVDNRELATTMTNNAGEFNVPIAPDQIPYRAIFRKEGLPETFFYFDGVTSLRGTVIEMSTEPRYFMGIIIREDD